MVAEEECDLRGRRGEGSDSLYPAIAFDLAG